MIELNCTGYIAKDAEVKTSPDGENYTTFSIAVSVGTKANPVTEWIQAICKGKLAEVAATYVKAGLKVWIRGRPAAISYVNANNKTVNVLRCVVSQLEWYGTPKSAAQSAPANNLPAVGNNSGLSSDVPF